MPVHVSRFAASVMPWSVLAEPHVAHDGLELMAAQVVGNLIVVDTLEAASIKALRLFTIPGRVASAFLDRGTLTDS